MIFMEKTGASVNAFLVLKSNPHIGLINFFIFKLQILPLAESKLNLL